MHLTTLRPSGLSQPVQLFRMMTLSVAMLVLAVTFSSPLHAQTYSDLYNFGTNVNDPTNPQVSGVIAQGRDGELYSTTPFGGSNGQGAAFKISPSGTLNTISSFTSSSSGTNPFGGLTLGTDGNLYGTTKTGGSFSFGTLFKLSSSGVLTTLYDFGTCVYPCNEGTYPISPPIEGADGNYYGTVPNTITGYNHGVVYKLTSAGKYSTLYAFDGTLGYNPEAPLMQATDGNLYGTTALGGKTVTSCYGSSNTCGTVFKITTAGKLTTIYQFDQTHGAGPLGPVLQGTDGNFYGTTSAGGTNGLGVVFKLTSAGVITVLHNFIGSDGETPQAGLIQANDGNFYGVASGGGSLGFGTIFKMTRGSSGNWSESVVFRFPGTPNEGTAYNGLVSDSAGHFYGATVNGGTANDGTIYEFIP